MAHIILTGATGLAGAAILQHALHSPAVQRITILSRRPVPLAADHPNAEVILHTNYASYPPELLERLRGATACIWAQGTSSLGVTEETYTQITVAYPLAAARAFAGLGDRFTFVYLSGEGANMERRDAGPLFTRVKGLAERQLLELQSEVSSLAVYNLRPGAIVHAGEFLAERKASLTDRGKELVGRVMVKVMPGMAIVSRDLAKVCVSLATGAGEAVEEGSGVEESGRLLRNNALNRLAKAEA